MSFFSKVLVVLFYASFCLTPVASVQAADTLVVPDKVAYSKSCRTTDKVKKECRLEEKTADFIKQYSKGAYKNIVDKKPASGDYHVLTAEITEVHGPGGGAWSGGKRVKIKGELRDASGKVLGTFEAGRHSGGGAFAGYKGTCSILGRCTKTLGKDVASWLVDPGMDSYLGDH